MIEDIPFAAALGRRFVTDLEQSTDAHGHDIFIETWDQDRRKPLVWYKRNNKGYARFQRGTLGTTVTNIARSGVIPSDRGRIAELQV